MWEWTVQFAADTVKFNSIFGMCLYWLPMLVCIVGYTMRTAKNIQKDKARRTEAEQGDRITYRPNDTIGDLIGRALISVIPIGNLWAAVGDVSPELFSRVFEWIGKTFDQPLVPERKSGWKENE